MITSRGYFLRAKTIRQCIYLVFDTRFCRLATFEKYTMVVDRYHTIYSGDRQMAQFSNRESNNKHALCRTFITRAMTLRG